MAERNTEKCTYRFDESTGILYKNYFGRINLQDITESWLKAFRDNEIPEGTRGFILDYRQASFDLKENEHKGIPEFYKKHLDVFGGLRIAIITEDYRDIVIPLLVNQEDEGYSSRPFSTIEAAVAWVLGK